MSEGIDWKLWVAYASLGAQAVLPIVLGSFKSIKPSNQKSETSSTQTIIDPDHDDDDEDELDERISTADSLMFPVIGSCMLVGMFFVLKYLDKAWLNWFLGMYFSLASVLSIQTSFTYLLNAVLRRTSYKQPQKYHLRFEQGFRQLHHLAFTQTPLLVLPLSLLLPTLYLYLDKPWYLTNVLSFTFAQTSISLLKLDGFKAGGALLAGLFVYDVVWVFGSEVMVTVAKGLDAPIKILAPRDYSDSSAGEVLLGLGDIIVPGIFISLALRYDYSRHITSRKPSQIALAPSSSSYAKPYFYTVLAAYVGGLVVTVVVMHTFKAAQPALLYLSPACIGSVAGLALLRGEFKAMLAWSDECTDSSTTTTEDQDAKHAKIIAASEAGDEMQTSAQQDKNRTASGAVDGEAGDKEGAGAAEGEEDDDWMKLDESEKEGEKRKRKKSGGKKKK